MCGTEIPNPRFQAPHKFQVQNPREIPNLDIRINAKRFLDLGV
jgi:hypothetical protein